jgi:hypothetical protein
VQATTDNTTGCLTIGFLSYNKTTRVDWPTALRDVNGCGVITQNAMVIDSPKFFTPNGDGNNGTWNIKSIFTQPSAVIYIFDRYGKLLK